MEITGKDIGSNNQIAIVTNDGSVIQQNSTSPTHDFVGCINFGPAPDFRIRKAAYADLFSKPKNVDLNRAMAFKSSDKTEYSHYRSDGIKVTITHITKPDKNVSTTVTLTNQQGQIINALQLG